MQNKKICDIILKKLSFFNGIGYGFLYFIRKRYVYTEEEIKEGRVN